MNFEHVTRVLAAAPEEAEIGDTITIAMVFVADDSSTATVTARAGFTLTVDTTNEAGQQVMAWEHVVTAEEARPYRFLASTQITGTLTMTVA